MAGGGGGGAATTTRLRPWPRRLEPGTATLTVTHDYGAQPVLDASESDPSETETVIRFLDREADITTRYGGGFVQSINGTAGGMAAGAPTTGSSSSTDREPARERRGRRARRRPDLVGLPRLDRGDLDPGRRRVVAEPFLQASTATPSGSRSTWAASRRPTFATAFGIARRRGRSTRGQSPARSADAGMRVLVGTWARLRSEGPRRGAAERARHERGLRPVRARSRRLEGLRCSTAGATARTLGRGGGAGRGHAPRHRPVTWVVTGTDARGRRRRRRASSTPTTRPSATPWRPTATALRVPAPESG